MNAVVSTEAVPAAVPPDDADRRSTRTTTILVAAVAVASGLGLAIAYRGGLSWSGVIRLPTSEWPGAWLPATGSACPTAASTPTGISAQEVRSRTGHRRIRCYSVSGVAEFCFGLASSLFALFTASVFLFGFLAQRLGVPRLGAIALAVIFAGTSFQLFGAVLSEPLFFFLVLLGLHGLVSFFRRPSVPSILLASIRVRDFRQSRVISVRHSLLVASSPSSSSCRSRSPGGSGSRRYSRSLGTSRC